MGRGKLGRRDEARTTFEERLRQRVGLGLAALGPCFSHADADWLERYVGALGKAGLKE